MPALVWPTVAVHESFLEAVAELRAEAKRLGEPDDERWTGTAVFPGEVWSDETLRRSDGFAAYVDRLRQSAIEDCPGRPTEYVPQTVLWWVDGATYLGRLGIRHRLTDFLLNIGGHIGYVVRPSARRQGHATGMLAAALPVAYDLGIDPALVTCDTDNVASRKVIEAVGGVLEDERDGKLRFWVPTGRPRESAAAGR